MKKFKTFLFWFAAEAWIYALVVANGRAYVLANYPATFITDMIISGNTFWFAKKFLDDKDNREWPAMLGCILGGGTGSLLSIFITSRMYGS